MRAGSRVRGKRRAAGSGPADCHAGPAANRAPGEPASAAVRGAERLWGRRHTAPGPGCDGGRGSPASSGAAAVASCAGLPAPFCSGACGMAPGGRLLSGGTPETPPDLSRGYCSRVFTQRHDDVTMCVRVPLA